MVKRKLKVRWMKSALSAVKDIYDFYKDKSEQGAKNVKNDIMNSPKSVIYPEQYQVDDFNPEFRRIIVRDYKVLYKEVEGIIVIHDVICTLTDPKRKKD